jgi:hypothetical protein
MASPEEGSMAIKCISRLEFDQFLPSHSILESLIGGEVEWCVDDSANTIGTLAHDQRKQTWSFAILRRNQIGAFLLDNLKGNFFELAAAKVDFLQAMAATG